MLHKAPAGSPSDERLETREWIVFVFRNEDKKKGHPAKHAATKKHGGLKNLPRQSHYACN